tara:strand:+ start:1359 stop:1841 length:483 start_codon:yes stop_codon:yes gene_type:complete
MNEEVKYGTIIHKDGTILRTTTYYYDTKEELISAIPSFDTPPSVHIDRLTAVFEEFVSADDCLEITFAEESKFLSASKTIEAILRDPCPSGSYKAVQELFTIMSRLGQGWSSTVGDNSGQIGLLDLGNRDALATLMSSENHLSSLVRAYYYEFKNEEWSE